MRPTRLVVLGSIGASSIIAVACGHDEPPAVAPIVAPVASAQTAPTPAPSASAAPSPIDPEFGVIGLEPVGEDGDDPISVRGNMWGDSIGDAFGDGGLGLVGIGEGGGGRGEGIGLGSIGTLGHGAGTGTGQGFGSGHGRLGDGGAAKSSPSLRQGATTVTGRLPPEVIQRIVRQNFGRFRLCYENGLKTKSDLQGRVTVKFVIDKSGSVASSGDGGSDLPDKGVVGCVVRSFSNLSFPKPEGDGSVTVSYPIIFSPGDAPAAKPAPKKK